jgi:hypothetical protein
MIGHDPSEFINKHQGRTILDTMNGTEQPENQKMSKRESLRSKLKIMLSRHEADQEALQTARPVTTMLKTMLARTPPLTKPSKWISVNSSWISALRAAPNNGMDMRVRRKRKQYRYEGVTKGALAWWLKAASKGKYWWKRVTQYSPAEKLN